MKDYCGYPWPGNLAFFQHGGQIDMPVNVVSGRLDIFKPHEKCNGCGRDFPEYLWSEEWNYYFQTLGKLVGWLCEDCQKKGIVPPQQPIKVVPESEQSATAMRLTEEKKGE